MGGRGQGPPRERATEGAERSEGAMPHRQFTIYFTTGCVQEDALGFCGKSLWRDGEKRPIILAVGKASPFCVERVRGAETTGRGGGLIKERV